MSATGYGQTADLSRVARAGDTMSGPLILSEDPVVPAEASTKAYVDEEIAASGSGVVAGTGLAKTGNTISLVVPVSVANLPAATTSVAGVVRMDGTASDIQPLGVQSAGSVGRAADGGHVHPTAGVMLTADAAGAVQTAVGYGISPSVGTSTSWAHGDHQHGTPSLTSTAPAVTESIGQAAAAGTSSFPARADHVHPMAAAAVPGNSAVGDTAAAGSAVTFSTSDHTHGREGFGPVIPSAAFGASSSDGVASTPARSDHVHGLPSLPAPLVSRQIEIRTDGVASTQTATVGAWTPTYLTTTDTGNFVGWVNLSSGAQNDQISFDFACEAGTYTLELLHLPFLNRGVYTIKIDGTTVGTVDGYSNSLQPTRSLITGAVLTVGQHVLTLLMATQNPSASGFRAVVERIVLTRTA